MNLRIRDAPAAPHGAFRPFVDISFHPTVDSCARRHGRPRSSVALEVRRIDNILYARPPKVLGHVFAESRRAFDPHELMSDGPFPRGVRGRSIKESDLARRRSVRSVAPVAVAAAADMAARLATALGDHPPGESRQTFQPARQAAGLEPATRGFETSAGYSADRRAPIHADSSDLDGRGSAEKIVRKMTYRKAESVLDNRLNVALFSQLLA